MKFTSVMILSFLLLILLASCSADHQTAPEAGEDPSSAQESMAQSETDSAGSDTDTLSDAVERAILQENDGKYLPGECRGVGYKIMEIFEDEDIISVYALTEYVEYRFEDNVFVNISGTNPSVLMRFQRTDTNRYELMDYTRLDIFSGLSDEELQALLLPLEATGKDYSYTDRDLWELRARADEYAAEYLRSIGREAKVGVRQDHEGQRLEELISDKELLNQLFKDDTFGRYPNWTGTTERLEDGIRYVYQTDFDEDNQILHYTKFEYTTNRIVDSVKVDVGQGTFIE